MAETDKAILLVEDNQQDEFLILRNLRKGHLVNHVDVVRDGQQALDYLFAEGEFSHRKTAELPVAVLLDIGLPRVSGLEVLARLRADQRTRVLPIIMLTSSDEDRDRLESYANGCNSFVRKPVDFNEFVQTISNLGIYWCAINLPPSS